MYLEGQSWFSKSDRIILYCMRRAYTMTSEFSCFLLIDLTVEDVKHENRAVTGFPPIYGHIVIRHISTHK